MQDILFDTGRDAKTNKASEGSYGYPRFLPPLTQSMSRVTTVQNPLKSPQGRPRYPWGLSKFPALPQKPTTKEGVEHWSCHSL